MGSRILARALALAAAAAVAAGAGALFRTSSVSGGENPPPRGFANIIHQLECPTNEPMGGAINEVMVEKQDALPASPDAAMAALITTSYPAIDVRDFVETYRGSDFVQLTLLEGPLKRMIVEVSRIGSRWAVTSFVACDFVMREGAGVR